MMLETTHAAPPRDHAVDAAIALLAETWPACFAVYERRRRPLKIGIHHDVLAALDGAVTPRDLRRYVHNRHYLWRMVVGAVRVGLDGNPAGAVTSDQEKGVKNTWKARWSTGAAPTKATSSSCAAWLIRPSSSFTTA